MILKGQISVIENGKYKVYFKEKNYISDLIPSTTHVGVLEIKDNVIVAFYDSTMTDGAIIGKV